MKKQIVSTLPDAAGQLHAPATGEVRLVSLVPSLTELICDLGLDAQLVGRTGFCIHPSERLQSIPKVGGTKDIDFETLRRLDPTHVVVNIDENPLQTVETLRAFVPHIIVTHPCLPEDNIALYRLFGFVFDRRAEAQRLVSALRRALTLARSTRQRVPPENVLYLIWREPWMSVSRVTYISAMLAAVGWNTQPETADARYPEIDPRQNWARRIDRVFLSTEPCHFQDKHLADAARLFGRPAHLLDGEMTSWYGSRAIAGLRYLSRMRRALARRGAC